MSRLRPSARTNASADHRAVLEAWEARDRQRCLGLAWEHYAADLLVYFAKVGVPPVAAADLRMGAFATLVGEFDRFNGGSIRGWLYILAQFELKAWRSEQHREERRVHPAVVNPAERDERNWAKLLDLDYVVLVRLLVEGLTPENEAIARALLTEESDTDLARHLTAITDCRWNPNMVRCRRLRVKATARATYLAFLATCGDD